MTMKKKGNKIKTTEYCQSVEKGRRNGEAKEYHSLARGRQSIFGISAEQNQKWELPRINPADANRVKSFAA